MIYIWFFQGRFWVIRRNWWSMELIKMVLCMLLMGKYMRERLREKRLRGGYKRLGDSKVELKEKRSK